VIMVCEKAGSNTTMPTRDEIADQLARQRAENLARRYLRDLRRTAFVDVRV
jgi:peptidyl-prolyl cis-trans isomerase SurA